MGVGRAIEHDLDQRSLQVIKALVDEYMRDGQTVSSERVSQVSGLDLSASSVRNILARLEDQGLLKQSHASSGRKPTARGIRIYLSSLLKLRQPSEKLTDEIRLGLRTESTNVLAKSVPELLARITGMVALVTLPGAAATKVAKLQFSRLSSTRIMAILITREGEVRNRLIEVEEELSLRELEQAAEIFNETCAGECLADAKLKLRGLLTALQSRIANLLRQMLAKLAVDDEGDGRKVYLAGEDNLRAQAQLLEASEHLDEMLRLLHHKKLLLRLIDKSGDAKDVSVFIGAEAGIPEMEEHSLLTAPYDIQDDNVIGALGVIGPMRMKYHSIIPLVRLSSVLMQEAVHKISSSYGQRP